MLLKEEFKSLYPLSLQQRLPPILVTTYSETSIATTFMQDILLDSTQRFNHQLFHLPTITLSSTNTYWIKITHTPASTRVLFLLQQSNLSSQTQLHPLMLMYTLHTQLLNLAATYSTKAAIMQFTPPLTQVPLIFLTQCTFQDHALKSQLTSLQWLTSMDNGLIPTIWEFKMPIKFWPWWILRKSLFSKTALHANHLLG